MKTVKKEKDMKKKESQKKRTDRIDKKQCLET